PAVVPVRAGVALHVNADHPVLRRPTHDVVVERIRFAILLLDLVARAAGNVHQNGARRAALIGGEDVDYIFWIGTEGDIAGNGDARIERRGGAVDVVGWHQWPVELRCAGWIDDLPD